MKQKNQKKFLVLKIIAFESETTNSHDPEQDTCHCQSMCYETPLRFNKSLKDIISEKVSLRFLKKKKKIKWSHADFTTVSDCLTC